MDQFEMRVFGPAGLKRYSRPVIIVLLACTMGMLVVIGHGRALTCAAQSNLFWRKYIIIDNLVVTPVSESSCPWQEVARARRAHAVGAYQEERVLWEGLLVSGSQQAFYSGRLANLALQMGDYSTAYRLFAESKRFDDLLNQALEAMDVRDWGRARLALTAASRTDSERSRADRDKILLLFGMLHAYQREVVQAESYYRQAIQMTPSYATAYMKWGQVLTEDGQYAQAAAVLQSALNHGLVTHGILAALGHNAILSGDLAAAEGYLLQAIGLDPHDPYVDATLADLQRVRDTLKTKSPDQ